LESKDLLNLCRSAGIEIKNSALAILSEEECAQVERLAKGTTGSREPTSASVGAASKDASSSPIRREDYVPASGVTRKGSPAPLTRPIGMGRVGGVQPSEKPKDGEGEKKAPLRRRTVPRPRVAAPPSAPPAAPAPRKPAEPSPQKPDLRLPLDAIRAGRKPLEDHIRKHEEKKRAETPKPAKGEERGDAFEKGPRPGAVAGREERQRRRGRRAAERREQQADEQLALSHDEDTGQPVRVRRRQTRGGRAATAPTKGKVEIERPITMRSLSEATGIPARELLGRSMRMGQMVTINATLDDEMAALLALELGVELEIKRERNAEEALVAQLEQTDEDEPKTPRPPIVTFLGHVDHGKTSLMDAIRRSAVAEGEAGGITQHIGAYEVEHNGHCVTFVDTPGHEAFTAMRARGANVTDITVLVVAADDGVMPQTEEAISHAKAADVPIVVALNKVDLPGANVQRVMQQLSTHDLLPTQWGGDTEVVETSAVTKQGIDDLLETLTTLADLRELTANADRPGLGTCLEASLSEGRGVMASLLVQNGALHVGDVVLCGTAHGRVKAMYNDQDHPVRTAGPSTPVRVAGLDVVPAAGSRFYVMDDLATARKIAEGRASRGREEFLAERRHITLDNLFERMAQDEVSELKLILKADMRGSIEALKQELGKLEHPEVQIRLLHEGIGGVTESDVLLADASDAVVVAFHVAPEERARVLADEKGVEIRRYDIIYRVTDDIREALEGLLAPEQREVDTGRALVLQTFHNSRIGTIAGCRILQGTIERSARVRLVREGRVMNTYAIASLRHLKDDVREVREGFECGIKLAGFDDVKEGDVFEAFRIEEVKRTL
jgi:translation initiation factor IF-2